MESLMQEFKEDLAQFRDMTEKFYAKEVSMKEYKGFSGGFGSYAQRRVCSGFGCRAEG